MPAINTVTNNIHQYPANHTENVTVRPTSWLKYGSTTSISPTANTKAIRFINSASNRNCDTSCLRNAPTTLRTPTSLARSIERATARLI